MTRYVHCIAERERIGAIRNRRVNLRNCKSGAGVAQAVATLGEAALQGKLRKRVGYVWYLLGERTAASQAAWIWSESCSLFQSSDRHKSTKLLPTTGVHLHPYWSFWTDWNHFAAHTYHTAARCTLRMESADPILRKGATAQTASLDQQDLCPEMMFFSNRSLPKSYCFYFT